MYHVCVFEKGGIFKHTAACKYIANKVFIIIIFSGRGWEGASPISIESCYHVLLLVIVHWFFRWTGCGPCGIMKEHVATQNTLATGT